MRILYSSPRIENVDQVVALMAEAGIETRVLNRDKIRRGQFQRFSYRNPGSASDWPCVQIISAEDLPAARALLRQAGLLSSTRPDVEIPMLDSWQAPGSQVDATASRYRRIAMIAVLAALVVLAFAWSRSRPVFVPQVHAPAGEPSRAEPQMIMLIDEPDPPKTNPNSESEPSQ